MATEIQERNPYVGPRPFERQDRDLFFGREREASEVLSLVIAHRVLLTYAQSGAGKTSLLNTRLIPLLEEEGFEVFPVARVRGPISKAIKPKKILNPYIFNTLMNWAESEADPKHLAKVSLADFLNEREHPIDEEGLPSPRAVVFDQFEELFDLYPDRWEDREGFFEQVREALEKDPFLWVVFVMREDYIARLDPYAPILPGKLRIRFRLERLREEAALLAVKGPLRDRKRSFAEGVAEKLVEELLKIRVETSLGEIKEVKGEFVEPVQLQLVCQNLWRQLPPDVTQITERHLQDFGDVDQVLSRFYDEAVQAAAEKAYVDEERLRAWCEDVLITSMGTRGTVYRAREFTGGIPNAAIDVLESKHLIRAEWRAGARWYELTHDRFIEPIQTSNKAYLSKTMGWQETEEASQKAILAITQGEQAWGMGNYRQALRAYREAQAIYQGINDQWGVANTLAGMAYMYCEMEDYKKAVRSFQKALSVYREIGDQWSVMNILASMGDVYHEMGEHEAADRLLQQVLSIAEGIEDRREAANILIEMGDAYHAVEDYEKAIRLFTQAIELVPDDPKAYGARAAAYWYWGRYPEAIGDFTQELELDPESFHAYNGRGQALAEQGDDFERALVDLDRAIELGCKYEIGAAYARNGRALAYGGLGQYEQALEEFDASIDESPDNAWVYYNRALTYERMGQINKAVADYKTALEKDDPLLNSHKREKAETRLRDLGESVS